MTVRPAKAQISLGIHPVWSVLSVAKDPCFLHVDSEDWSNWADAQAGLNHCWAHMPFWWFCHEGSHICQSRCTLKPQKMTLNLVKVQITHQHIATWKMLWSSLYYHLLLWKKSQIMFPAPELSYRTNTQRLGLKIWACPCEKCPYPIGR